MQTTTICAELISIVPLLAMSLSKSPHHPTFDKEEAADSALQAGVILSDYATLMVEILKDNARPDAGAVYGAMDMPWAKLVGQIAQAYGK
jgi:hypothetical protein